MPYPEQGYDRSIGQIGFKAESFIFQISPCVMVTFNRNIVCMDYFFEKIHAIASIRTSDKLDGFTS
jgi:hypothetical protein